MHKLMTQAELQAREDITDSDKAMVDGIVDNLLGGNPDSTPAQAVRSYVVSLMDESELDDNLRQDLEGDASAFSDGWDAAFEISDLASEESLKKKLGKTDAE